MLVDFIASLIILSFAFRLVLIIIGLPVKIVLTVLLTPVTGGRVDRASYWAAMTGPVLLAVLYGAFIAVVAVEYSLESGSQARLTFLICGAVVAFFSLISYSAGLFAKMGGGFLGENSEDRAYCRAAFGSMIAGFAAFPLFYFYPHFVIEVPGAEYFFGWAFKLAAYLSGFRHIRIILVVFVSGYFLFVTAKTLLRWSISTLRWLKGLIPLAFRRKTLKEQ